MLLGNSMLLVTLAIAATPALAIFGGGQNWYNLKTKFAPNPFGAFTDQPRTVDEAEAAGWTLVSDDCTGSFPGKRYAPPSEGNSHEMIMIYDVNGFIAGMHSVINKESADESPFEFEKSSWYRLDDSLGYEAFLTTAYFVDPATICEGGRDQAAFDSEGTGNVLWFQHGDAIHKAPLTGPEADASEFWMKHKCFVNMGRHYFNLFYDADAEACNPDGPLEFTPIQLLYSGGVMNGFVWQHAANPPNVNNRWENVDPGALKFLIDTPPKCLYDFAEQFGVVTQHVYFRNYLTTCLLESK